VKNYEQAVACRLLLGFAEAGIFPALTFIVSTIWPRESQAKRVAVLYGASALAGAFGGLIAYGIQLMGERHGLEAWRWLFIVEGIISIALGLLCWATLPKSSEHAWFLKPEERQLMLNRRQRDFAYKGESKLSLADARMAFTDPMVLAAGLALFCAGIPLFGFGVFLPTIIRGLGFEDIQVNYLTIPVYVFGCMYLAAITYISDRLRKRAVVAVCAPVIVIIGYAIVVGTDNVGAGYFAMFLCAGVYSYNTLLLTWVSNNIRPDSKRSAALPWFICLGNISGVAASQIYPNHTAPRYVHSFPYKTWL
jgi:MFS family permease